MKTIFLAALVFGATLFSASDVLTKSRSSAGQGASDAPPPRKKLLTLSIDASEPYGYTEKFAREKTDRVTGDPGYGYCRIVSKDLKVEGETWLFGGPRPLDLIDFSISGHRYSPFDFEMFTTFRAVETTFKIPNSVHGKITIEEVLPPVTDADGCSSWPFFDEISLWGEGSFWVHRKGFYSVNSHTGNSGWEGDSIDVHAVNDPDFGPTTYCTSKLFITTAVGVWDYDLGYWDKKRMGVSYRVKASGLPGSGGSSIGVDLYARFVPEDKFKQFACTGPPPNAWNLRRRIIKRTLDDGSILFENDPNFP
jgi:diadenosine tetraphosphatase ApaH/serine/threonine PP2A family protein phosphatase